MTLSEWLKKEGLTVRAAQKRFRGKLTYSAISQLANNRDRAPRWSSLLVILKGTDGQVTPNDFLRPKDWPKEMRA